LFFSAGLRASHFQKRWLFFTGLSLTPGRPRRGCRLFRWRESGAERSGVSPIRFSSRRTAKSRTAVIKFGLIKARFDKNLNRALIFN